MEWINKTYKVIDQVNNWAANVSAVKVAEGLGWLGGFELLSIGLANFYDRAIHAFEVIFYPVIGYIVLFFVQRKLKKMFPK